MKWLRKGIYIAALSAAVMLAAGRTAEAAAVIDFKTGLADEGGLVTLFSDGNLSGSMIPIGKVTITGAPTGNGGYTVGGSAIDSSGGSYGALNFSTGGLGGSNYIEIVGYLEPKTGFAGLGSASSPVTLMSGSFTNFNLNHDINGDVNGLGSAIGWTSTALTSYLGLSDDLQFTFLGWSMTTESLTASNNFSGASVSTDVRLTAVPEPGSLMLMGSGALMGLGKLRRRFRSA
jgi:hypothetical protein